MRVFSIRSVCPIYFSWQQHSTVDQYSRSEKQLFSHIPVDYEEEMNTLECLNNGEEDDEDGEGGSR